MSRRFNCPHCRKVLNPGTKVVLLIDHNGENELILLSAELGDYSVVYPLSFEPEQGRKYILRCPACHVDLTSSVNGNLVELEAETDDGSREKVAFSRIWGEHATFVGTDADHVTGYGDHVTRYDAPNFFGVARSADEG